jgi:hypothetical protein
VEIDLGAVAQAGREDVVAVVERRRPQAPVLGEPERPDHGADAVEEAGARGAPVERCERVGDDEGEQQRDGDIGAPPRPARPGVRGRSMGNEPTP